ncbi:TIGR01457 family HAD-type hydrolase [Virgibacillus siamensis]|uniref:TIGR01457 family HAD-type hydrolase n=1 Tax=Virgibacillus siamensis TaxID=480071 RepID=UPI000986DC61|nr:TIGR01457 family HAD-type hydrolase [Virgibacillus siamensis]
MRKYNAYLIDLDGTMYKGNERIEAAGEFVDKLVEEGIPYLFLTNNSSRTQEQISDKLKRMDIQSTPEHVFTSSLATAKFIRKQHENARCYVIGEEGLHQAINDEGLVLTDKDCDFVVVGIDRDISYDKLSKACIAVRNGATFISTNSDAAIPTERGLEPGNGALTSVITVSTGQKPTFIGKPEEIIMEQALETIGSSSTDTLMVGDNYHTDILAGINAGLDTLMVFTGVTPFADYPQLAKKPTYYVQNLYQWMDNI